MSDGFPLSVPMLILEVEDVEDVGMWRKLLEVALPHLKVMSIVMEVPPSGTARDRTLNRTAVARCLFQMLPDMESFTLYPVNSGNLQYADNRVNLRGLPWDVLDERLSDLKKLSSVHVMMGKWDMFPSVDEPSHLLACGAIRDADRREEYDINHVRLEEMLREELPWAFAKAGRVRIG